MDPPISNPLDIRILDINHIQGQNLDTIVRILNDEWGNFFTAKPAHIENRIGSRQVLVGAYENDQLVGVLETLALRLEGLHKLTGLHQERAYAVSEMIDRKFGNYAALTYDGNWRPFPNKANVLTLVDITIDPKKRGLKAAPQMIEFGKQLLNGNRPPQFNEIEYVLTFTPDIEGIKRWHESNWAFDTGYRTRNEARPGYKESFVNFMCYLAPGYVAPAGQRQLIISSK